MKNNTARTVALALAFAFTLSMLAGIDHLAQVDAVPAAMAQASAPQA